jgi:uncharacterized protein YyaL (SSP411 family)
VAIAGPVSDNATRALVAAARRGFNPNHVLAVGRGPATSVPLLKDKPQRAGRPTAYVCEQQVCKAPTSDPEKVAALMAAFTPLKTAATKN